MCMCVVDNDVTISLYNHQPIRISQVDGSASQSLCRVGDQVLKVRDYPGWCFLWVSWIIAHFVFHHRFFFLFFRYSICLLLSFIALRILIRGRPQRYSGVSRSRPNRDSNRKLVARNLCQELSMPHDMTTLRAMFVGRCVPVRHCNSLCGDWSSVSDLCGNETTMFDSHCLETLQDEAMVGWWWWVANRDAGSYILLQRWNATADMQRWI